MKIIFKSKKLFVLLLMQQIMCGMGDESVDDWASKYEEVAEDANRLAGQIAKSMDKWHNESENQLQTVVFLVPGKVPVIFDYDLCIEQLKSKVAPYLLYAGEFGHMLFKESSDDVSKAFLRKADFPEPLAIGIFRKEKYEHNAFERIIVRANLDQSIREYLLEVADFVYSSSDWATKDFERFQLDVPHLVVLEKLFKHQNPDWQTIVIIVQGQKDPILISKKMSSEELVKLTGPAKDKPVLILFFDKDLALVETSFKERKCPDIVRDLLYAPKGKRNKQRLKSILAEIPSELICSIESEIRKLGIERRKRQNPCPFIFQ